MGKAVMKYWKSQLLNKPQGIVIVLGLVVFGVEFLLMALLHDVIIPVLPFQVSQYVWNAIDAVMLLAFVAPVIYFLVFRRMQQDIQDISELNARIFKSMQQDISELGRFATSLTDAVFAGVLLVDKDLRVHRWNQWLADKTGIASQQACGKRLTELFTDFRSPRLQSAVELCIDHQSPQLISQALNHYVLPIPVPFVASGIALMRQQVSVMPLTSGNGEILAVVSINDVTENVAKSSALAQMARKLELQSNRDQLTGAYNRHFLWAWLDQQLKQCVRHGQALGCLMLDIDHFKRINDTYGHDVGDAVLRGFARLLNEQLRDSDILVRYGGEEFVALLPHADAAAALVFANRILGGMRNTTIAPLDAGAVRCSIGVASWTPDAPCSPEELLKEADRCLYQAKQAGRDQVVRSK